LKEQIQSSYTYNNSGQGSLPRHDLYVMEVNYGRNHYSYRGLGYLARNCRNFGNYKTKKKG